METVTKYFTASYKLSQADILNEIDADNDLISLSKDTYLKLEGKKWRFHYKDNDYYFNSVEELINLIKRCEE